MLLSTEIPLQLPVSTTLLKQSHNQVFHSNPQHLNLHAWCGQLQEEGLSVEVAERIAAPQRSSTRIIYKSKWTLFEKWCRENSVDSQDLNRHSSTIDGYRMAIVDTSGLAWLHTSQSSRKVPGIFQSGTFGYTIQRRQDPVSSTGPAVLFGSNQRPERVSIPTPYFLQERKYLGHQTRYALFLVKTNYPTSLQTSRPTVLGLGPSSSA